MDLYFLNVVPDKIVIDDIKKYVVDNNYDDHSFCKIYKGKTCLYPNSQIENMRDENSITLYNGAYRFGNVIKVDYSIKEKQYIFYKINNDELVPIFTSVKWNEFNKHVRKYLYDLFVWFNEGS